ncbi:terminase small subunit, partial [Yersinia pestis]
QSVQHETVNAAIMTYTEALERLTLIDGAHDNS